MSVRSIFGGGREAFDWDRWTQGFFGPVAALHQSIRQLDQHLTVAATHPGNPVREVRLDMAERSVRAARRAADELELAIVQAREALKREVAS